MQDLRKYIANVKDLEISLYKQNAWCGTLKATIESLQNPTLYQIKVVPEEKGTLGEIILKAFLTGMIGATTIGLFLGWLFETVAIIVIVGIIGVILGVLMGYGESNKKERKSIIQYNEKVKEDNKAIQEDAKRRLAIVEDEYNKARENYMETEKLLNQYYDEGIIFEKYRALVPVCMFYEYLESGRCSQLEGHEGAYNLYENELRLNIIIGKLDDIIKQLDAIKNTQYTIAAAIQEGNNQLNSLIASSQKALDKFESLERNTELTAYYSRVTALNTTCQLWLE